MVRNEKKKENEKRRSEAKERRSDCRKRGTMKKGTQVTVQLM